MAWESGGHRQLEDRYHNLNLPNNCMNNPNPSLPRTTLKLKKVDARKPASASKSPSIPQPEKKAKLKPGAHWSDEYKERMQADMDRLLR